MRNQQACPRRALGRWLAALSLAIVAVVATSSASALADEPITPESASVALSERRAAEAFQAYSKREFTAAVALYLEAYEAAPSGSILYNVARIYDMKLGDRPLAINFYRRYIADPGANTELIVDANDRLRALRAAELAAVRLTEKGPAPQSELKQSEAGPRATDDIDDERRTGWSPSRWAGVSLGALGLVGVAVGAGFGLSAMSKAETADDHCAGNACTSQMGVDAANDARRDATISNISFAMGGALLVTGGAFLLWGGEREPPRSSHAGIRWGTRATATELALQVSGRW